MLHFVHSGLPLKHIYEFKLIEVGKNCKLFSLISCFTGKETEHQKEGVISQISDS